MRKVLLRQEDTGKEGVIIMFSVSQKVEYEGIGFFLIYLDTEIRCGMKNAGLWQRVRFSNFSQRCRLR